MTTAGPSHEGPAVVVCMNVAERVGRRLVAVAQGRTRLPRGALRRVVVGDPGGQPVDMPAASVLPQLPQGAGPHAGLVALGLQPADAVWDVGLRHVSSVAVGPD